MSKEERDNFVPENAVQRQAQTLDREWAEATERAYDVPLRAARVMESSGDFLQSAIEASINEIVETYQAGRQTYNLVTDVIESDCTGKWSMLLRTALPAAGAALWLFIVPSPKEILENYLEPKALKSTGRGGADSKGVRRRPGKSGRFRRFFPRIPDVDKMIADRLPGAQAVQGRKVGKPTQWLFTGINIADRVAWHYLVLEATEEFFVTWSSGIMESRFCSSPLNFMISAELILQTPMRNWIWLNRDNRWDFSERKGTTGDATGFIHFTQPVSGTIAFNCSGIWDPPPQSIITNQWGFRFYLDGTLQEEVLFDAGIQEGDTTFELGAEASHPNFDEIEITMGNITTSPLEGFINSGALFVYGSEVEEE